MIRAVDMCPAVSSIAFHTLIWNKWYLGEYTSYSELDSTRTSLYSLGMDYLVLGNVRYLDPYSRAKELPEQGT